ncbi:MAG: AMP-binding protein [Bacteroides sp.]|nr:AMP-binding protein [Roseburia sp.]MCM1346968.1 AMP-binding protein [Bacteroides sp.]MCM1421594.1 AMP-binding protein [Bacteroides sp.]
MHQEIVNETSLLKLVENAIRKAWERKAFTDYGTDESYTYRDVAQEIKKMHIAFELAGIREGDRIALCDKNSSRWAITFLSILTYKAVAVPILSDFNGEQIDNIFAHSEAKLIICGKSVYAKSKNIDRQCMVDITTYQSFPGTSPALRAFTEAENVLHEKYPEGVKTEDIHFTAENPEDMALISYTSGSTGNSKGVMLPYRSLWSNVLFADERLGLDFFNRTLSLLPMAHMYGFSFEFMYEVCLGCHLHFLTKVPSPNIILEALANVRPAIIIAVPLIIEKVVKGRIFPMLQKQKIRHMLKMPLVREIVYKTICKRLKKAFGGEFYEIIVGGAAFNGEVEAFLKRIKFPFTVGYGMTECGPIICYEDWKKFTAGSCGKGVQRMEVRIQSENPEQIPGEIICRGTNVMLGYYKNEEATREAIDADGWLHTGDLATTDSEGNIFIRGRKKNMLLGANGQNIYPEEVEDKIMAFSLVDECLVVQRGEKLTALVYVSDSTLEHHGMTRDMYNASLEQYRKRINEHLPRFAMLSSMESRTEEFEKTPKKNIKRFLYE